MAYVKKVWAPRVVQYPGREILTPTGNSNEFDLARSEGIITAPGDILSVENLNDLETKIFNQFGIVPEISSGTWTPTLHGSTTAGSPTFSSSPVGSYYKVGKLVIITVGFSLSSKGGMAGQVIIGGLPFTVSLNNGVLCITSTDASAFPENMVIQSSAAAIATGTDVSAMADGNSIWASTGFYICQ